MLEEHCYIIDTSITTF